MGKENPGAGFEYPAQEVSWLKRDVLLFAASIGCTADELQFLYVRILLSSNVNDDTNVLIGTTPQVRRLPNLPYYPP